MPAPRKIQPVIIFYSVFKDTKDRLGNNLGGGDSHQLLLPLPVDRTDLWLVGHLYRSLPPHRHLLHRHHRLLGQFSSSKEEVSLLQVYYLMVAMEACPPFAEKWLYPPVYSHFDAPWEDLPRASILSSPSVASSPSILTADDLLSISRNKYNS